MGYSMPFESMILMYSRPFLTGNVALTVVPFLGLYNTKDRSPHPNKPKGAYAECLQTYARQFSMDNESPICRTYPLPRNGGL